MLDYKVRVSFADEVINIRAEAVSFDEGFVIFYVKNQAVSAFYQPQMVLCTTLCDRYKC